MWIVCPCLSLTEDFLMSELVPITGVDYKDLLSICRLKKKNHYSVRQDNVHIFNKIIFVKYRTRQIESTETNVNVTYLNLKQQ